MKDNKVIYELLNRTITDCEHYETKPLTLAEKSNIKKWIFEKNNEGISVPPKWENQSISVFRFKKWIAIVAIFTVIVISLTTPIGSKVYAAAENMLEKLQFSIGEMMGRTDDISQYAVKGIGSSVEVEGIQIKLDSVIVDRENNEITTLFLIDMDSDRKEEEFGLFVDKWMKINGKETKLLDGTGTMRLLDEKNNIYSDAITHQVQREIPKGTLDIEIVCEGIYIMKNIKTVKPGESAINREINQKISFFVQADGDELAKNNITKNLQNIVTDDEYGSIEVQKIQLNPVTQKVFAKWMMPQAIQNGNEKDALEYMRRNDFSIEMITDTGKKVEFEPRTFTCLTEDNKYIVKMEYEFGKVGSNISPSDFFREVKNVQAQFLQNTYDTSDRHIIIQSNRKFGQPFRIELR